MACTSQDAARAKRVWPSAFGPARLRRVGHWPSGRSRVEGGSHVASIEIDEY